MRGPDRRWQHLPLSEGLKHANDMIQEQRHALNPIGSRGGRKVRRCRKCSGPKPDVRERYMTDRVHNAHADRSMELLPEDTPLLGM